MRANNCGAYRVYVDRWVVDRWVHLYARKIDSALPTDADCLAEFHSRGSERWLLLGINHNANSFWAMIEALKRKRFSAQKK